MPRTYPESLRTFNRVPPRENAIYTRFAVKAWRRTSHFVLTLIPEFDSAFLDIIDVEPAHRGKGIGTETMRRIERLVTDSGMTTLALKPEAVVEGTTPARIQEFHRWLGHEPG